ncbi:MAG TPA: EAL domain-containing protein [Edaphobacter sp.]|jgi:diguanylate cyclase (GGDEF)-like protein|nr:EAL domain-containing protein [Edaphobacter sp.]
MHGTYNYSLVALSLAVAILASYTTLDLAARISMLPPSRRQSYWLMGGAASMGIGIWSMHFIGMLAFHMPIALGYDRWTTGFSLVIAIGVSHFALHIMTADELGWKRLLFSGILVGAGIAAMHYVGMEAMRMHPAIVYAPWLFCVSIAIAVAASWVAIWMAFHLRDNSKSHLVPKRLGASLVMGVAVAGMHYTAMAAARFQQGSICGAEKEIDPQWLVIAVTVATLCILGTLLVSRLDLRFAEQTERMNLSLEQANRQLLTLATRDILTGMPNRTSYMERAAEAIRKAKETGRPFTVMFMDLDGFKAVNDSLGHSAGDRLLKEFSAQLMRCIRREDTVARLGGDEFVLLLEGLGEPQEVELIAKGVLSRIHEEICVDGLPLRVTASIGIATYPRDGDTVEHLLKSADMAMYDAKQNGRNTFRFFDSAMSDAATRTLKIYRGLGEALAKKEMSLVFQPKFGLDRVLMGAEALIRWKHPEMGNIPPLEFISIAEQTGLIVELCDWVIDEVCRNLNQWTADGLPRVKVAINLSPEQLRLPGYVERVSHRIASAGVKPDQIMFEITETVAMRDADRNANVIRQFQKAGFDIAIDDFGTGYSSLAYLQQFRVKQLKIDRFFTNGLDSDGEEGLAIVAKMIELAHSLKMIVVAEGVETASQLKKLEQLECDEVQGFLLGRPLVEDDFKQLLERFSKSSETIRIVPNLAIALS